MLLARRTVRELGTVAVVFVASFALGQFGCNTHTIKVPAEAGAPTEPAAAASDEGETAGVAEPDDETEVDAGVDAAPPPEQVVIKGDVGQSCEAVCSQYSYACATTCQFGTSKVKAAGSAVYEHTKGTSTGYSYVTLETCTERAESSVVQGGNVYTPSPDFGSPLSCCCLAPGHFRIEGNAKAPKSCNDVCKANGMTCDPKTSWGLGDYGGVRLEFACQGAKLFDTDKCSTVPPTSTPSGSTTCTLSKFTCGCL